MEKMIAIEPINGHSPGEPFDATAREAEQLEGKGLAKRAPAPLNKVAPKGEDKNNPSEAGGEAQPSSASPPAQASRGTTAKPSVAGEKAKTPAQKAAETRARNRAKRGE